jgi:hypothetical protein
VRVPDAFALPGLARLGDTALAQKPNSKKMDNGPDRFPAFWPETIDWAQIPGVKKAWPTKGFEGVPGMAFHPIICEVKDVDADGKPDIFRCRSEKWDCRMVARVTHNPILKGLRIRNERVSKATNVKTLL